MLASAKPLFPALFFFFFGMTFVTVGRTRALFLLLSQHSEISDKSCVSFTCLCGVCSHRLMFSALCCNCYFPDDDDDDDEWTHMVLGFRASRLHCPPQSFQPTATRGRDCGSDSAQWCHLWFFAPETDCLGMAAAHCWIELSISGHWQVTEPTLDSVKKKYPDIVCIS